MSEATGERIQLQGLTEEQRQQFERNVADLRRRGTPVTSGVITEIIRALRQQAPVPREGRSDSQQRNRDAASGRSTVDFLPEELHSDKIEKMQRQVTEIGKNIEKIQADTARLENYKPPPGKKVERRRVDEEKEIYQFKIEWEKYGWSDADKNQAKRELRAIFDFDVESAERAAETLLLAGYTAREVLGKIASIRGQDINGRTNGEKFYKNFSDDEHIVHNSALKIVFNEESRYRTEDFLQPPRDMEELAWQMSWSGNAGRLGGRWMVNRANSMFDIRGIDSVDSSGQRRFKGKYTVNEANFREWFLDQTNVLYDIHGPDGPIDAMTSVKIDKGGQGLYDITFRQMIEKQNQLFVSEDQNTQYMQMWLQLQYDESNFITLYTNDVIYRQASKQGLDEWIKKYEEMSFQNFLTKLGFRSNMVQRLLTGAQFFEEGRTGMHDDTWMSDNKLGTAFLEMALAFYNLGDLPKLQQILGKDSMFFTWKGWAETTKAVATAIQKRPRGAVRLDKEAEKHLNDAFMTDEEGNPNGLTAKTITGSSPVTNKKAFQEFLRLVGTKHLFGSYQELFMRTSVQLAVQDRYKIKNSAGLDLYAAQAWFFNRLMGGMARNDVQMAPHKGKKGKFWSANPSVHDKMSELLNLEANRDKYQSEGGGKPAGNMYTRGQFKSAIVDPYNGIVTQEGYSIRKVFEALHGMRVEHLNSVNAIRENLRRQGLSDDAIDAHASILQAEEEKSREYMGWIARNVQFREDQQIEYVQVHMKPGKEWAQRIMNGEGLDFSKFTNFDPFGGGATVDRGLFVKEIQKKMIGTLRDLVKKYNHMNFDDDVRVPFYNPKNGDCGFREGKLWEQEFGYDLLNRKEFWKTDEKGRYIKVNGLHVIDGKKVNDNRVILMKQMFLKELHADMYSHQVMNSGDLRFPPSYYLNVIDALKKMPGQVIIDEFKAHGYDVPEGFWTKEDFKYLEKRALNGGIFGSGKLAFMTKWFFTSLVDKRDKEGLGFGKSFGMIWKAVFS